MQSGHLVTLTALPDGIVRLVAGYVDESGELTIQWTSDPLETDPREEPVLLSVWVKRYVYSVYVGTRAHRLQPSTAL